jgi:RNA polymerase sigma factor (sigma-70 family)
MANELLSEHPGDRDLVAGTLAGDRECFGALVDRYWATAVAIAFSRMTDVGRAEDVAQESFVHAWTHLRTLRDPSRFVGWLSRIVVQQSAQHHRQDSRTLPAKSLSMMSAEESLEAPSYRDLGLTTRQRRRMHEAIRQLPDRYQTVVVLRFISGLSTEQIAHQLRMRQGTVRVHLHRACTMLRRELSTLAEEVMTK